MEITVIRHTPLAIEAGICYGQMDVPLKPNFQDDFALLKAQLSADYDRVFTSPQQRCVHLTEFIGLPYQTDHRLMEFNFGTWEGKAWTSIQKSEIDPWYADFVRYPTPGGESMQAMFERLSNFLNELRSQAHNNVLIVTHGGIIRFMWCYLLQIPLENTFKVPVGFGEVFRFNLGLSPEEDFIQQKV